MGLCCSSGLLFSPKLEYLLSPTPIQLPLLGSEFARQIRLNSSPRPRRPHKKNKFPQKKKEKKRSHSCQPKILYAKFYLELQSVMSSIIKKKKKFIPSLNRLLKFINQSHYHIILWTFCSTFSVFFFLPNKASKIENQ